MDKKKILLASQAVLCILWVVLMAAAAINLYRQSIAWQAQGHPEAWIYTREKSVAIILRYAPVLALAIIVNIISVILGVRDENQDKPSVLPELTSLYKSEREAASDPAMQEAKKGRLRIIRAAVMILALVFIIVGIVNGSMEDMLIKAINICTECIGLG